jgi:nitric oxide reductase NorD protein
MPAARKYEERVREELERNLRLFYFEDSEIGEVFSALDSFGGDARRKVFALCLSLSGMSGSLVPKVLRWAGEASRHMPSAELGRWVDHAFYLLDSKGLEPAVSFLSRTDEASLVSFMRPEGLQLEAAAPRLETYLRGLSGRDLKVRPAEDCYTDTSAVFLPHVMNMFSSPEANFLIYKLMAAHAWAQSAFGTFHPSRDGSAEIGDFFDGFPERRLALDLYAVLEALRLEGFLRAELPALMEQAAGVKAALLGERPSIGGLSGKAAFVEGLYRRYLGGRPGGAVPPEALRAANEYAELERPSAALFGEVYGMASRLGGPYEPVFPVPYLGVIKPEKVSAALGARKRELRERLALLLSMPEYEPPDRARRRGGAPPPSASPRAGRQYLLIKGRLMELDKEFREFIEEMGGMPEGAVLVDGAEVRGRRLFRGPAGVAPGEQEAGEEAARGGVKYDEWDYKRGDYRRGWCTLYESDLYPSLEPFVDLTLRRYRGYVSILRKKFELLRREPRTLRRQKDGEGIDIDATVEAMADLRAGISPRGDYFTRLDRLERDIAVLFLLDMSGSTRGWVNRSEKEALVLMCEALEALGDRYAIYGFSGMTRNRSEFYRIKSFSERYSAVVKRRIAGITPRDYTRMGPPIRHASGILMGVEASVRLLVTLSDGKPEDYDAYKGDRGIEDTRKALIEARHLGIHPFCITIDREAGSYLPHMFGEGNYIFIDDVRKLPARITEIYRKLTT